MYSLMVPAFLIDGGLTVLENARLAWVRRQLTPRPLRRPCPWQNSPGRTHFCGSDQHHAHRVPSTEWDRDASRPLNKAAACSTLVHIPDIQITGLDKPLDSWQIGIASCAPPTPEH